MEIESFNEETHHQNDRVEAIRIVVKAMQKRERICYIQQAGSIVVYWGTFSALLHTFKITNVGSVTIHVTVWLCYLSVMLLLALVLPAEETVYDEKCDC